MDEDHDSLQRLFFAIWPSDAERRVLVQWRDGLRRGGGRAVPARNVHLTLAFAGDVDAATRDCLEREAARVHGEAFELTLDRAGVFRRGLLWAGPSECPAELSALAEALERVLVACGVRPDTRPFLPHVTLVRNTRGRLPEGAAPGGVWQTDQFCLVRSRPGRPYEVLRRYPLGTPAAGLLSEHSGSVE